MTVLLTEMIDLGLRALLYWHLVQSSSFSLSGSEFRLQLVPSFKFLKLKLEL
jgi:hypothetical protein